MPKKAKRLSAYQVNRIRVVGLHAVGGVSCLYLCFQSPTARSWILRAELNGDRPELGLGPYPEISLQQARAKAAEWKALMSKGIDPRDERRKDKAARKAEALSKMTFAEAARACHKSKSKGFKNAKHAKQWIDTLTEYAFPVLGDFYPEDIETSHVMKVLGPIWEVKTDTASKLRGRIESTISYAFAHRQIRGRPNPAAWKNNLDHLLTSARRLIRKKKKHHPAVYWKRMPEFMAALRARGRRITKDLPHGGLGARMLELAILTTSRDIEVRGAEWSEFDLDAKEWTVPPDRMKGGLEHKVPLSDAAVALLKALPRMDGCKYVFPGAPKRDGSYGIMSNSTMGKVLDDIHEADIKAGGIGFLDQKVKKIATPHGTARSSFKDWSLNCTSYRDEVSELCLAHVHSDETRSAYARDQLMDLRRPMLEEYSAFLSAPFTSNVTSLAERRAAAAQAATA